MTDTTAGQRSFWLRHLHRWHWISSALCLIGMLLFAFTGITLNHAAQIEARPAITERAAVLPAALLASLATPADRTDAPLPPALRDALIREIGVDPGQRLAEWSDSEIYLALPRPGGDAWLSIDLASGELLYEHTDRGWIAWLNDLHKGRNTGTAWAWFIDIFAVACLVFCLTGLFLLHLHGRQRPATWPLVGLGLVAPLLLIILFIHS